MQNKEKKNLEDFSLPQLNILLKHLRLGLDHLKLLLTPKQLAELFNSCELNQQQKQQISATGIEKLGNMSLIINTILTSTFGAWMGLSGCIGCQLGSFKMLLFISTIAFFVSGVIGFMSLRMTTMQAHDAINNQLINILQLRVLKIINQKLQEKVQAAIFYLNTAVFILENKTQELSVNKGEGNDFKTIDEAYEWFEKLNRVLNSRLQEVNDPTTAAFYQKHFQQTIYLIKKTLAKHVHFLENLALSKKQEKKQQRLMSSLPFLKILTNPAFGVPKYRSLYPSSWIKSHFNQLILGVIPTIWGGFASMFVFVGGIPNIARELSFTALASFLTTPLARTIEISLAAMVTCYFAFAFFYSSRKSWQRQHLLEKTEKEMANEETLLLENSHKLDMLFKVKNYTQKLISNFTAAKKVDQNLANQESQEAFN